jgi:predicted nuclease of predicted toxin-antitoxin system
VLRFVSDENFDGDSLRGLFRSLPELDVVRVQDVGLRSTPDPDILKWAAVEGRVLLTHDKETMVGWAIRRTQAGQPMPGVFLVSDQMPVGQAIEELHMAAACLTAEECRDLVRFFPL